MATRKPRKPSFDDLCRAVQALPAPRSQAEWRKASTAMRTARRAPDKVGRTIWIECDDWSRRIYLESTWGGMRCYNGPSPVGMIGMISFQRRRYTEGSKGGRVQDARDFATASRRDGPVPLP